MAVMAMLASCSSADVPGGAADAGQADAQDGSSQVDAGCGSPLPSRPATPPSYAQTVEHIIATRCAGCHFPGSTLASEDLTTYASVLAKRGTVLNEVYGCVMPPATSTPPTPDERASLLAWLVCGAPNN
jgi:uncharacterized membrane protein